MNIENLLKKYHSNMKDLSYLGWSIWVLYQDMETNMPINASEDRWEQIALLSKIYHTKTTDKWFWRIINNLFDNQDNLSTKDKRSVVLAKKSYDQACKVPKNFVGEFEKAKTISQNSRTEAKKNNNYKSFMPHLKRMFDMSKQYAEYINPNEVPYNTLLDIYEEWINVTKLNEIFDSIKNPLKDIISQLSNKENKLLSYEKSDFEKHKIKELCKELVSKIWFDFSRGNIWEVHHPYQTSISNNDIRINTNHSDIISCITGIIHELWHWLYEQNISSDLYYSNLWWWVSHWIHESQSRLLENIIWRSHEFSIFLLPLIQKYFPETKRNANDVHWHLTNVRPSLIRIESDEVTYNMHIIIRFELEQVLLSGELSFEDLPNEWNEKMKKYLWISPSSDRNWCMQDVHRSSGLIWYFPTYTLGNLLSAQLRNKFIIQYPSRKGKIINGDFSEYISWFKDNIRQYGSLNTPNELVLKATWEPLNPKHFLDYIKNKYIL